MLYSVVLFVLPSLHILAFFLIPFPSLSLVPVTNVGRHVASSVSPHDLLTRSAVTGGHNTLQVLSQALPRGRDPPTRPFILRSPPTSA